MPVYDPKTLLNKRSLLNKGSFYLKTIIEP